MWYKVGESDSDLENQEDEESGSANQPSGKQGFKEAQNTNPSHKL